MRLNFVGIFVAFALGTFVVEGEIEKKCFAPVVCSTGQSSQPSWQQVYPPVECKTSNPDSKQSGVVQPSAKGPKGEPGAIGPKGEKGDQGDRGVSGKLADAGSFNDSFVEALIQRLAVTEARLKRISQTLEVCPVFYNNSCFYAHTNGTFDVDAARTNCEARGGNLANIYNTEQWNAIIEYVRKYKMAGMKFAGFYTGMRVDPSTWKLLLRNGSAVGFVPTWFPRRPSRFASQTYVSLNIEQNPDPARDAFLDSDGIAGRFYLCEI